MKLEAIIAYLCKFYPYSNELSSSRLTKLIYLADWFSCILEHKQMTNIKWYFNHYGPYVDDILDTVRESRVLDVEQDFNYYGNPKYTIKLLDESYDLFDIYLNLNEKKILDFVINKTKTMYYNDFINYVYSTYPVATSQRYDQLNLAELASTYNQTLNQ